MDARAESNFLQHGSYCCLSVCGTRVLHNLQDLLPWSFQKYFTDMFKKSPVKKGIVTGVPVLDSAN